MFKLRSFIGSRLRRKSNYLISFTPFYSSYVSSVCSKLRRFSSVIRDQECCDFCRNISVG